MKMKELKKGDMFTLKPLNGGQARESQIYIRSDYDRSEKKYWATKWSNISDGRYISGDREVYDDFTF